MREEEARLEKRDERRRRRTRNGRSVVAGKKRAGKRLGGEGCIRPHDSGPAGRMNQGGTILVRTSTPTGTTTVLVLVSVWHTSTTMV